MPKGNEKGFTLLELLIAMSILSVSILGLATMLSSGIGTDRFAHMIAVEGSVGSSVVEEIVARDPSDPIFSSNITGAAYDLDPDTASTVRTVQGRTYSATYSISVNNPVSGVSKIDVTVINGTRTVSFTAFKSTV
ncbi:MAG: prepilin-type N-terminal cleavage/methylation domain-containing protein [Deltaproteobacteria bacterium]|nr:prepilin-type N-terminal cleavage/methylation domain-containing protein [Deltaproteobacteria bacterium]